MAHHQSPARVSGLQLAVASITLARRFKDLHPKFDCVFFGASAPFLWWKAFRYAAAEVKKNLRTFGHLGLAIEEGWIQREYASGSAAVNLSIVHFEGGKSTTIPQNQRLSIVTSILMHVMAVGNLLTTSEYVGVLRGNPDRPSIKVHVDFLQQGQQASQVTRLRISNDLYETPLILVQNPAPLVERALDALFHDNIPLSDLDKSLSWSTLLIFHLALEAWEADTKHSLPTFHLSFASFAGLLTAEDLDLEKRKIQNRLDELDERLPKIHDLVNSSGNDEQAKLETTRNVFEAMYQLLTVADGVKLLAVIRFQHSLRASLPLKLEASLMLKLRDS
ncbi:hypothetical protein JCM5353_008809 [Sporobolomyces roseus]